MFPFDKWSITNNQSKINQQPIDQSFWSIDFLFSLYWLLIDKRFFLLLDKLGQIKTNFVERFKTGNNC